MIKALRLFLIALLIPSLCLADSELTIGGKTGADHIIQNQGSSLRPRPYLNFTGDGVTAADSGGKTVVTIDGYAAADARSDTGWTRTGTNIYQTTLTDNVGIGTLSPDAELSITSTAANSLLRVNDNGPSDTTPFLINSDGNVGIGTSTPQTLLAIVGGNVGIGTTTAANGRLIVAGGNVGIGSSVPGQLLDVAGTARATAISNSGAYTQTAGTSANTLTGDLILSGTAANIRLGSNYLSGDGGDEGVLVTSDGAVGIGISSPLRRLHVSPESGSQSPVYFTTRDFNGSGSGTGALVEFGSETGDTYTGLQTRTGGGTVNGGALVLQRQGGNVGIGSTNPGTVLDVVGKVRASTGFQMGTNVGISTTGVCSCTNFQGGICVAGTCT